jgi:hypothetical protein
MLLNQAVTIDEDTALLLAPVGAMEHAEHY